MRSSDSLFRGYSLVLLAAVLWGAIGLFYTALMTTYRLPALEVIFWRALIASAALFLIQGLRQRRALILHRRDWLLFLGFGLIGVAGFYAIYIQAIALTGMGVAAVLMYTAPAWVTVLSTFIFHERLTARKVVALILAVSGCALVGRVYDLAGVRLNLRGLLAGLGAGLGYGLYILFSKAATQRHYSAWTTMAYALGLGALCLLPLQDLAGLRQTLGSPPTLGWLLAMGLVPTLGGAVAFNAGLHHLPASNASIIATLEPVVAAFLGWAVLGETLALWQMAGAGLILSAVVLLQTTAGPGTTTGSGEQSPLSAT